LSVPRCFGNAVEYDEHHGVCGGCAHRLNCANDIQRTQATMQAPRPSYTSAAAPPPPPPVRPQYSAPQYSTTSTQYHAAQYPPPGVYNFDEPVAEQFGAYVGFSFLDSLCVELRHLVGASRTHYMTKRRKP
jgi:hypothetical protein